MGGSIKAWFVFHVMEMLGEMRAVGGVIERVDRANKNNILEF